MDQIAKIKVRYSPDEIVGEGEAPANWQEGWEQHLKRELSLCYPGVELDVAEVTWEGQHGSPLVTLVEPTVPDPEHPRTPEHELEDELEQIIGEVWDSWLRT